MKTIVLCSSASFYKHVNELADELEGRGFKVLVPKMATKMKQTGNYDTVALKTWYDDASHFSRKTELMRLHFNKVERGDAVLIVNDEKNGVKSYIGPNGLMEMGLAFYLKKPIYILNAVDKDLSIYEEVVGMGSIILDGDLDKMKL